MPLQHLQLLAVFEADQVVGRHRLLDRHRRLEFGGRGNGLDGGSGIDQAVVDGLDDFRDFVDRYLIVRQVGGDDLSGEISVQVVYVGEPFSWLQI